MHTQPESLAMNRSSVFIDETREDMAHSSSQRPPTAHWESAPGNGFGGYQNWDHTSVNNNMSGNNIWGNANLSFNNSIYSGGAGGDSQSVYSSSTTSHHPSSFGPAGDWYSQGNNQMNEFAASMNRLNISNHIPHNGSNGNVYAGGASVASMTNSIPGLVGASSGSTGGSTAASMWRADRSMKHHNFPTQHLQQHGYQNQYSSYQERPQVTSSNGVLPGSGSHFKALNSTQNDDSISFDSRPSTKSGGGKRRGNNHQTRYGYNNRNNNRMGQKHHSSKSPIRDDRDQEGVYPSTTFGDDTTAASSKASSEAIRMLMKAPSASASLSSSHASGLAANRLPLDRLSDSPKILASGNRPILPAIEDMYANPLEDQEDDEDDEEELAHLWGEAEGGQTGSSIKSKKREWLLRMNRRMAETPVGKMDPSSIPISAVMNAWAKTKCAQGASMVENWLKRAQQEFDSGNTKVVPTTKMYTMAGKCSSLQFIGKTLSLGSR